MHHTDVTITLKGLSSWQKTYRVEPHLAQDLRDYIEARLGGSVPAAQVLGHWNDPAQQAASVLRGMRLRESLTQKQLAEKLGIRQHHLSEMENAKRAISKDMARKLSTILRADYRVFL